MAGAEGSGVTFAVLSDQADAASTDAERIYGASLRFPDAATPYVFANFVQTIDGVVSLGLTDGSDASAISGHLTADRFLMAMLRAAADVIVIGARTLHDSAGHQWIPEALVPEYAAEIAAYRRAVTGRTAPAPFVVVSSTGSLADHVALRKPATPVTVLTTNEGRRNVERLGVDVRVVVAGDHGALAGAEIVRVLRQQFDARRVLCEGGPTLLGTLLGDGSVHELFLTVAPSLAGHDSSHPRLNLIEGWSADPRALRSADLLSVRGSDGYLFLRYALHR